MLSIVLLAIVFLYRRFRRTAGDVPWTCQAAAAIALSFGVVTAIAGAGQSVPVAFFTLSEREYRNLQVLWFTTGAMLLYRGHRRPYPSCGASRLLKNPGDRAVF